MNHATRKIHRHIGEELLEMLAKQVSHAPLGVLLSMSLIAIMADNVVSQSIWMSWLVLVMLLQGMRWWLYRRLPTWTNLPIGRRLRMAITMNVANTLAHSMSLMLFLAFTPYERAVQSMVFLGLGVVSILTTAGFLSFAVPHVVLGLLPLFGLWAWAGISEHGGWVELGVCMIGVAYSITLIAVSKRVYNIYSESFANRMQLADALGVAERAGRAKTRFLASASHDLRQPVHNLSLFTASLIRQQLDSKAADIAHHIDIAVQALTFQLDSLLDVSRLDAGVVKVNESNIYLHTLLSRLKAEFELTARERSLHLSMDCPIEAIVISDPALLERVIRNLLSNAIKYTQQGSIQMRATPTNGDWTLSIADTGPGIPIEEHEHIFEEFYQLGNPHRDHTQGLGLGLAIVRRTADLLSLDLAFESSPGWGTTFSLTLKSANKTKQPAAPPEASDLMLSTLNVLVVDDDAEVRHGMKTLLELLGCQVSMADGTQSAIRSATRLKPDIALIDLRLRHDDDGLKTVRQLRNLHPELPMLLVTGDTAPHRIQQAESVGVPLLHKPVPVKPLRDAIKAACHL